MNGRVPECLTLKHCYDRTDNMIFREIRPDEYDLLKVFLYEAIYVPEGEMPPDHSIIELPDLPGSM